jgi:hypothetical protein
MESKPKPSDLRMRRQDAEGQGVKTRGRSIHAMIHHTLNTMKPGNVELEGVTPAMVPNLRQVVNRYCGARIFRTHYVRGRFFIVRLT